MNPERLAAKAALPEESVRLLLAGSSLPKDTVNARVCARIKTVAAAYRERTGASKAELATELHMRLGISDVWARQVCEGKKTPNVDLLTHLAVFFGVGRAEGGVDFFTAPADQALDSVLQPTLKKLENTEPDPVNALLDRYGVKSTDLRMHGSMTRDQLERLLEGVLRSVVPPEREGKQ
jgi:hypothetical protein